MKRSTLILAAVCGFMFALPAAAMVPQLKAETALLGNVMNYCVRPLAAGENPEANAKEKALPGLKVPPGFKATGAYAMPGSMGWATLLTFDQQPLCQILVSKIDSASLWAEVEKFMTDPAYKLADHSTEKTGDGTTRTFVNADGKGILTISVRDEYVDSMAQAVITYAIVREIPPPQ